MTSHRVELLVEAVAALPDASPVHLRLIGDGPERRQRARALAAPLVVEDRPS